MPGTGGPRAGAGPADQKIQIIFLYFYIVLYFPENAVPFINNNHKRIRIFRIYLLPYPYQIFLIRIVHFRILPKKFPEYRFLYKLPHLPDVICFTEEILHI